MVGARRRRARVPARRRRFGRDVLSRLLYGARASLGLALVATAGTLALGALLGAWAGYAGGLVERASCTSATC